MKTITQSIAPVNKVSSQGSLATQGYGNKGLCLFCGEIFNLKDWWQDPDFCPDCAEVFEEEKN